MSESKFLNREIRQIREHEKIQDFMKSDRESHETEKDEDFINREIRQIRENRNMETEIIFKEESYKIVGACFEVYREKGCGFVEPVYQECMEIEMRLQGIVNSPQKPLALEYKGQLLSCAYCSGLHLLRQNHIGVESCRRIE
jgi:PD-(D/E)XK nuclease superfamily